MDSIVTEWSCGSFTSTQIDERSEGGGSIDGLVRGTREMKVKSPVKATTVVKSVKSPVKITPVTAKRSLGFGSGGFGRKSPPRVSVWRGGGAKRGWDPERIKWTEANDELLFERVKRFGGR